MVQNSCTQYPEIVRSSEVIIVTGSGYACAVISGDDIPDSWIPGFLSIAPAPGPMWSWGGQKVLNVDAMDCEPFNWENHNGTRIDTSAGMGHKVFNSDVMVNVL